MAKIKRRAALSALVAAPAAVAAVSPPQSPRRPRYSRVTTIWVPPPGGYHGKITISRSADERIRFVSDGPEGLIDFREKPIGDPKSVAGGPNPFPGAYELPAWGEVVTARINEKAEVGRNWHWRLIDKQPSQPKAYEGDIYIEP